MEKENRVIRKRSIVLAGHKTSVSLEDEFMDHLRGIAARRKIKVANLIIEIDGKRRKGSNLSGALRLAVLADLKATIASLTPKLASEPTTNRSSVNGHQEVVT